MREETRGEMQIKRVLFDKTRRDETFKKKSRAALIKIEVFFRFYIDRTKIQGRKRTANGEQEDIQRHG